MKIRLSPQHQDMLLLQWPILLLVIAFLASAVWCGGAYLFKENTHRALQTARTNRVRMTASVRQIEDEEKTVRSFIDRYRQLATEGVISDEDRLELVEAVNSIRARHALYPVQLDIEQQAMLPLGQNVGQGNPGNSISYRVSRIRLTMPLLHEEDLSHLLEGLRDIKRGIFIAEECSIKRTGENSEIARLALHENLTASCKILWLTLKEQERNDEQEPINKPPEPGKM